MKRLVVLAAIVVLLPGPPASASETTAGTTAGTAAETTAATAAGAAAAGTGSEATAGTASPPAITGPPSYSVTLITGDRVSVTEVPGGRPAVHVEAARWPGRRVTFHTTYDSERIRVVPSDVALLVNKVLDPALFDLKALRDTGALRVIMQGGQSGQGRGTALSSIGATVETLTPEQAQVLGASLVKRQGPQRIWLDAVARAQVRPGNSGGRLDHNLTQIGAPSAWARGLSGSGVKVAVLDTGVDPTHPDLAKRILKAENFSDSPTVDDRYGHGTHVASILAGDGTAAGGSRRGVAFGAQLLSGKVLGDDGSGSLSDIIEGMQWAADQGARIVNMSLGTDFPSAGDDPVSQAVDSLTASHGTLFVVSAGNGGPGSSTVGSPGAATEALTVGAVDGKDRLADFSSRGPRPGDQAVKPELTAPGVDIIAARAAGSDLADPIGRFYIKLSGTSMAAPHVAGAAALLAQHHPQWTGKELKALLTGTAESTKDSAFDVGAGRLDIPDSLGQTVIATQSTLSFGFVAYPPTPQAPRTITFANKGNQPATLDLASRIKGLRTSVKPARLTIQPGQSATASVSVAVDNPEYGAFAGAVETRNLAVPLGIFKEPVHHFVHLNAFDREGTDKVETLAWLVNLDDVRLSPFDPVLLTEGVATARIRPGHYAITAAIPTLGEEDPPEDDPVTSSISIATATNVLIDGESDLTLDARNATPISASVRGVETTPVDVNVFVAAQDDAGTGSVLAYQTSAQDVIEGRLLVQPTTPTRQGKLELSSKWRLNTVDGGPTYDLLFAGPAFPADLHLVADPATLARVETLYRAPAGYQEGRFVYTPTNPVSIAVQQPGPNAPARRFEFLSSGIDKSWFQCVNVLTGEAGIGSYCQPRTTFRAGETAQRDWLRAPLRTRAAAFRLERQLFFGLDELGDDAGSSGSISSFAFGTRSYTLSRNGIQIEEGRDPTGLHPVPRGPATFTLTRSLRMSPGLLPLSTAVDTSWTFTTPEGILDAAVHVPLNETNVSPRRTTVEVTTAKHATVTLELSYDNGKTWRKISLQRLGNGRYRAPVTFTPGPVSLRTTVRDRDGNHTEQTVIGAFTAA